MARSMAAKVDRVLGKMIRNESRKRTARRRPRRVTAKDVKRMTRSDETKEFASGRRVIVIQNENATMTIGVHVETARIKNLDPWEGEKVLDEMSEAVILAAREVSYLGFRVMDGRVTERGLRRRS